MTRNRQDSSGDCRRLEAAKLVVKQEDSATTGTAMTYGLGIRWSRVQARPPHIRDARKIFHALHTPSKPTAELVAST